MYALAFALSLSLSPPVAANDGATALPPKECRKKATCTNLEFLAPRDPDISADDLDLDETRTWVRTLTTIRPIFKSLAIDPDRFFVLLLDSTPWP